MANNGPNLSWLGGTIGGVGSLIGAGVDSWTQQKINKENYDMQKEFAQNSLQWKMADAKKAGIHPLVALGAQTYSASPSSVASGSGKSIGRGFEKFGQAIDTYIADDEDRRRLENERLALENKKLEAEINGKFSQGVGSLMSSSSGSSPSAIVTGNPDSVSSQKLKEQTNVDKSIKVGNGLVLQKPLGNGDFYFTFDPNSTQGQKFSEDGFMMSNTLFGLAHLYDQLRFGGLEKLENLARERGYLKKGEYFHPVLDPAGGFFLRTSNEKWTSWIDDVWNFGRKGWDLVVTPFSNINKNAEIYYENRKK